MLNTAKIAQLAINTALPRWSKQTPWKRLSSSLALAIGMGLCLPTYAQQVVADIAVLNGVVLVTYVRTLREEGMPLAQAIRHGCEQRFRPVMMTATVALLGLVPFLFATGPGSEVQRPLAIVVIGGLITSTLLTLVVLPVLYRWFEPPIESKPAE